MKDQHVVLKLDARKFNAEMKKLAETIAKFAKSISAMKRRQLERRGISFGEAPKPFRGTDI